MYRLLVCFLALLLPASLHARQVSVAYAPGEGRASASAFAIQGRVLDATGAPVAAARVTVRRAAAPAATPITVLTDAAGEFNLPAEGGTYVVHVDADGFVAASERIQIGTGQDLKLEIILRVAGFSEIVNVDAPGIETSAPFVSAMKTQTPLRDVPQAVSIVSKGLMADQRMSSMADVVRYMPGVGMAQGEGNRDTPILRGNSSTADFFVDGVRDDVQYFRDVYNLERVEALKGPNAMIFGRGGAGGVINRVTRQADWRDAREISVQLGSWDNRRVTADVDKRVSDRVAARVTGVYENSDSYRNGVGIERYGVQPSVAFQIGGSTLLRASYEYFHDDRVADRGIPSFAGRPVITGADTFFGDPANSPVDATVNVFASVLEHEFSPRLTLRNRVSYGVYDKFYQNVYPSGTNAAGTQATLAAYNNQTDRNNLFNQTDVIVRQQTGRVAHTILAGAEFGRQATDNMRLTGYFTDLGPSVTTAQVPLSSPTVSIPVTFRQSATDAENHGVATVAAIYAQDQVQLTSWLQAVGGIRFDAFNFDFTNNRTGQTLTSDDRLASPRVGLIYKPILPVSIYGSYSLTYLPRAGEQLSSLTISNQSLEPEKFSNYEAGIKWDLARSLSASAAVYHLDRGNVAIPDPNDSTKLILVDAQRTKGIELELNGSITRTLDLVAGYAYQDGQITRAISSTTPAGAVLAQVPKHSLSFWGKYAFAPRWAAAVGVIHRADVFAAIDNLVVLPAFTRVDGGIFFDVNPRLRAQVNLENLLDESYFASAHNNSNITPGSPRAVRFAITSKF